MARQVRSPATTEPAVLPGPCCRREVLRRRRSRQSVPTMCPPGRSVPCRGCGVRQRDGSVGAPATTPPPCARTRTLPARLPLLPPTARAPLRCCAPPTALPACGSALTARATSAAQVQQKGIIRLVRSPATTRQAVLPSPCCWREVPRDPRPRRGHRWAGSRSDGLTPGLRSQGR